MRLFRRKKKYNSFRIVFANECRRRNFNEEKMKMVRCQQPTEKTSFSRTFFGMTAVIPSSGTHGYQIHIHIGHMCSLYYLRPNEHFFFFQFFYINLRL